MKLLQKQRVLLLVRGAERNKFTFSLHAIIYTRTLYLQLNLKQINSSQCSAEIR